MGALYTAEQALTERDPTLKTMLLLTAGGMAAASCYNLTKVFQGLTTQEAQKNQEAPVAESVAEAAPQEAAPATAPKPRKAKKSRNPFASTPQPYSAEPEPAFLNPISAIATSNISNTSRTEIFELSANQKIVINRWLKHELKLEIGQVNAIKKDVYQIITEQFESSNSAESLQTFIQKLLKNYTTKEKVSLDLVNKLL